MSVVNTPPAKDSHADEDQAWVLAVRAGHTEALAKIYERYARVIQAVIVSRGVPISDAEDVTQDVFMNAMRRLDDLREPRTLGAWLMTSARHRAADWVRSRRAHAAMSQKYPARDRRELPLGIEEVLEALSRLPEAYRETLALRLIANLTGPQIAQRTGLSEGSVRVNLHRGMNLLREMFGEPTA